MIHLSQAELSALYLKSQNELEIYKEYYEAEQAFHLMLPIPVHQEYVEAANRLNKAREAVRKLRGE